ncbi:MAG: phosphomannomutase [Nitrosopumilus sp.]|nr:phosphomannomutase [Nitrosopumilus sp.]
MKKTISGIRGIFGDDFTLREVLEFCNNFSSLITTKKCVIGKDTRPSGIMVKECASASLRQNGVDLFDLGTAPTPVVFHESRKYGSGIVITSSHNPIEWNGLKFIIDGRGINESELPKILENYKNKETSFGSEEKIESSYLEDAKKIIGTIENTPKITVDIGGGAAKEFAPSLLEQLGCEVQVINPDLFDCSRGPDPTSDNLTDLVLASAKKDIGFAFDLDGDRLVVVKDGVKQTPDITLGLGVAKSLDLGYKNYVLSIDTSVSIEKFILENGGTVQRSKVGEANVIDLMIKTNAQAGGEGSSAGFILPEFNFCREGILTSGLIASMFGSSQFNDVLSFMGNYIQIREKTNVDSSYHDKVIEKVTSKLNTKYSEVITLDGIKGIIDEDSWVLIRKSNTEDIIRISAESNDLEKCQSIVKGTTKVVNQCYEEVR